MLQIDTKCNKFKKDLQFYKFCSYGFIKNLRFFDPFIILFFRQAGFSFLQIGLLFSIREISVNIFEIPSGLIADTVGRRRAMIFAFTSYIFSFLVFYFWQNYYIYIGAMIFFAGGEAFRTGTHKAMILEYLKIKKMSDIKVYYYGSTRSWSQIGSAFSSIIAAILVFSSNNYRIIFISSVIPYIFGLLLMLSYPAELDGERKNSDLQNEIKYSIDKYKLTFKNFISLFKNRSVLKTMFNSALFDAFFKIIKDYLQPLLKTLALSMPILLFLNTDKRISIIIGAVYFFIFLLASLSSKNAGKIQNSFKSPAISLNNTFLIGALLIFAAGLFYHLNLFTISVVFFVLYYMLQNTRRPMAISYISDLISHKIMATGLSSASQIKAILIAVFSPILGFLADKIGIGNAIISFSILSFVLYFFVKLDSVK